MARNSPVIGDAGITATKEEINALTKNIKENFIKDLSRDPIDLHNPVQVKQAIYDYFDECEKSGKRPGNMGLYRALDLRQQDVSNILLGYSKKKASPDCIVIIQKALQSISEYREQLGLQGKINPVSLIFWQKNYDGLSDIQQISVQTDRDSTPLLTQSDIEKRIPVYSDVDIDMDNSE